MELERNDELGRFEMSLDGHVAYITFAEDGDRLELIHTSVPEALEGRGIGGDLVRSSLAYAREHNRRVTPTCSFVRSYLERHPEEQDVVDA